jgi:Tubulin-tyrosine ligase family
MEARSNAVSAPHWLWQKINHFPGTLEICRKKPLARNLASMARCFPQHCAFLPRTFLLPEQLEELTGEIERCGGQRTFIVKPSGGSQVRRTCPSVRLAVIPPMRLSISAYARILSRPFIIRPSPRCAGAHPIRRT